MAVLDSLIYLRHWHRNICCTSMKIYALLYCNNNFIYYVCWQFTEKWLEWSEEYNCSRLQLRTIFESFASNLKHVARSANKSSDRFVIDSQHHHAWSVPPGVEVGNTICPRSLSKCQCGQVRNDGQLVFNSRGEESLALDRTVNLSPSCDVLDSFVASTKALNMAVSVANMVLTIEHCIQQL